MRILGICGSLRNAAYSLLALEALKATSPPPIEMQILRLFELPIFNPDEYEAGTCSAKVGSFREQIVASDGILISTPEYNHSIPGVLKNALEWLHGKPGLLEGKPAAIVSTAPGPHGGIHAQRALRLILESMDARLLTLPEICIGDVRKKFDALGVPTNEATRESLEAFMQAYLAQMSSVSS
jgi:chromate reductase